MPNPEIIQFIVLIGTVVLLFGTLKYKVCLPSAYLSIIVSMPGVYYPFLGQIRFELIIAIIALLFIIFSNDLNGCLSLDRSRTLRYMFYFLIVILLSMIQAFDIERSWNRVYEEILPNIVLVLLLLVFCKDRNDITIFFWVFGILMVYLGYEPIFRYLHGDLDFQEDFSYATAKTGLVTGHTSLGNYSLQGLSILWYLIILNKNKILKLTAVILFSICLTAVFISGARGGMIGLGVMFFLIAILSKHPVLIIIGSSILVIVGAQVMGGGYIGRMLTIFQGTGSGLSAQSRLDGIISGIEMMINRPILGVGPGCYPVARKAWFGWSLWSHNHYGQLAGELGLIGIVIWFRFALQYIRTSWEMRKKFINDIWIKNITTAIIVTSILRLVLGMGDHSLFKFIWYMLAAIVIVLEDITRRDNVKLSTADSNTLKT